MKENLRQIHSVRKFYLLEYFYILLASLDKFQRKDLVFNEFKNLKQEHRLGESKYKKITIEEEPSSKILRRYMYTFEQVIDESKDYELITEDRTDIFVLTKKGNQLLNIYKKKGIIEFCQELFKNMERIYHAFRYIINFLYRSNSFKSGFLIFPVYSPRQLGFERSNIKTTDHIIQYSEVLMKKLRKDIKNHLGRSKNFDLSIENKKLLDKLLESGLITQDRSREFDPKKYNVITKRFRDFWITYFLRNVYQYEYSMSSFDIWTYRGKQIGIIHATEFFPGFHGRVVYPTSVVLNSIKNNDFDQLFEYEDGDGLFIHYPEWREEYKNMFVDNLVDAYFDLRRPFLGNFINLSSLRELVCYHMKISEHVFGKFLDEIYKLNLSGQLSIRISLEVDKLPEETKATYIKREPVMVDGKYRNIIAIDIAKK